MIKTHWIRAKIKQILFLVPKYLSSRIDSSPNVQDEIGSAIDDYSEMGAINSKSRMRPPLNKQN